MSPILSSCFEGGNFLMRTPHGDLDVFAVDQTAGAPREYEQLRARAVAVEVLGVRLLIAHPEDLIRMKSAAAAFRDRPEAKRRQDLDDIAVLERARDTELAARTRRAAFPSPPAPDRQPRSDAGEASRDTQRRRHGRDPRYRGRS